MFYQQEVTQVFKDLGSSEKGLPSAEARKRLETFGKNKIGVEKKAPILKLIWNQFNDPLIWVLLLAAGLSFAISHYLDVIVILALLLIDAILGFVQEYKAEKAILLMRQLRQYQARVIRDGKDVLVDSDDLVPGDVLFLAEGDKIPADCRLFDVVEFEVDEASLTGESHAVRKIIAPLAEKTIVIGDQKNMVFAGTVAVRGDARAVVVATGA